MKALVMDVTTFIQIICGVMDDSEELDSVAKGEFLSGVPVITLEFIKSWTGATICDSSGTSAS